MSYFKEDLRLSDNFFEKCKVIGALSNKGYLVPNDKAFLVFNFERGIYVYGNFRELMFKELYIAKLKEKIFKCNK